MQLLGHPTNDLSHMVWECACIYPSHLCNDLTVSITLDPLDRNIDILQTRECFTWHGARDHIAADDDKIDRCVTNILEHRLKRGEVSVNIIECCDPHTGPSFASHARH
jgi:hypothetical protein